MGVMRGFCCSPPSRRFGVFLIGGQCARKQRKFFVVCRHWQFLGCCPHGLAPCVGEAISTRQSLFSGVRKPKHTCLVYDIKPPHSKPLPCARLFMPYLRCLHRKKQGDKTIRRLTQALGSGSEAVMTPARRGKKQVRGEVQTVAEKARSGLFKQRDVIYLVRLFKQLTPRSQTHPVIPAREVGHPTRVNNTACVYPLCPPRSLGIYCATPFSVSKPDTCDLLWYVSCRC